MIRPEHLSPRLLSYRAPDASGRCLVVKDGGSLRLFVYEGKSTTVTVSVTAPAVGDYRPHSTVVTRMVR